MADRSPNYPQIGLDEALAATRLLRTKEGRSTVLPQNAAAAMGYRSLSGPARAKLAALKKYALIDEVGANVKVSDLALRIIHGAEDSAERLTAIREAALKPELFKTLYETLPEASDNSLASKLVLERSFSEAGAKQCVKAYRATLALAKLDASGYTPPRNGGDEEMPEREDPFLATPMARDRDKSTTPAPGAPIPLRWSLPDGVVVEVRFSGPVTQKHLEMMGKYLALAKETAPAG